jgi:hypothetical protein
MTCWTLGDTLIFMTSSLLMPPSALHRQRVHKHKQERPRLFFSMWARQTHEPGLLDYLHRRVLRDQLGHLLVGLNVMNMVFIALGLVCLIRGLVHRTRYRRSWHRGTC